MSFILNSILSDINTVAYAFFVNICMEYLFHFFIFYLYASFCFRCISQKQYVIRFWHPIWVLLSLIKGFIHNYYSYWFMLSCFLFTQEFIIVLVFLASLLSPLSHFPYLMFVSASGLGLIHPYFYSCSASPYILPACLSLYF